MVTWPRKRRGRGRGRNGPRVWSVFQGGRNVPRVAWSCDYATQTPHRACEGAERTAREPCLGKALKR